MACPSVLWQPATGFGLITPPARGPHISADHTLHPRSPYLGLPSLPLGDKEVRERKPLASKRLHGCRCGGRRWDKRYFRLFLLLVWVAHDWFQKKKCISLQTYFYHRLEFLDALLTKCIEGPGLLQRGMERKMDNTLNLGRNTHTHAHTHTHTHTHTHKPLPDKMFCDLWALEWVRGIIWRLTFRNDEIRGLLRLHVARQNTFLSLPSGGASMKPLWIAGTLTPGVRAKLKSHFVLTFTGWDDFI